MWWGGRCNYSLKFAIYPQQIFQFVCGLCTLFEMPWYLNKKHWGEMIGSVDSSGVSFIYNFLLTLQETADIDFFMVSTIIDYLTTAAAMADIIFMAVGIRVCYMVLYMTWKFCWHILNMIQYFHPVTWLKIYSCLQQHFTNSPAPKKASPTSV